MELDMIQVTLASPQRIREWGRGEVKKSETLNYRTGRPEVDGLFCERIFGPTKDLECACGKYRKMRVEGRTCDRCGVEVTYSRVRRRRMAYITLAAPVAHIWYFRGVPSYLSILLDIPPRDLERIIYYADFIVVKLNTTLLQSLLRPVQQPIESSAFFFPTGPQEEDPELEDLLSRLNRYEGELKDIIASEIQVILTRAQEKSYIRETYPLDILSALLTRKELHKDLWDDKTGEVLVTRGTKLTHSLFLRLLTAGVPLPSLQVTDGRVILTLQDALSDALKQEELARDLHDPTTGHILYPAGTSLHTCIWAILQQYHNHFPISIANKEVRKIHLHARERKVKQIREMVEGLEALCALRPYDYLHEFNGLNNAQGSCIVNASIYRDIKKVAEVIDRRATGYTSQDIVQILSGGEAIHYLLKEMDISGVIKGLREQVKANGSGDAFKNTRLIRILHRLNLLQNLLNSGNRPEWLVLQNIPVIPPELRPMVQLEGGRHATSDLNELYRLVITRNNRLMRLIKVKAPEAVIRNEKRILQEAVDSLLDNTKKSRPQVDSSGRPLKSLADTLKGKQGRFRQNLLGKRVDYSGRAVIVVGPHLKIYQVGIPRMMALEIFRPFVYHQLIQRGYAQNIKAAKRMIDRVESIKPTESARVWECLEAAMQGRVVLLNRAPTLHRLGIQAFEPILVDGEAILLHPLVCAAFNADFDGDQMAVHLPLSVRAQVESRLLMLSSHNILLPADGTPLANPTQDMVLGCHYLTLEIPYDSSALKKFPDLESVERAYANGYVGVHDPILVRIPTRYMRNPHLYPTSNCSIQTTVGRVLLNLILPEPLRFVNETLDKTSLKNLVARCFRLLGEAETIRFLDDLKELGFMSATRAGISLALSDVDIPKEKKEIVQRAEREMEQLEEIGPHLDRESWVKRVEKIWSRAVEDVAKAVESHPNPKNPLLMMVRSGSRGTTDQMRQLCGMRGLMSDPSGRIIPMPIKSNFREGLSVHEYFISTHGGRKGLTDTALRTAKSGYLTRRLVDLAQEVFICEEDCHTRDGMEYEAFALQPGQEPLQTLQDRILGRISLDTLHDPETGEIVVLTDSEIDERVMEKASILGIQKFRARTPLTCESPYGICARCYGRNLATGSLVEVGEAVGIIAAQAIGEPGTQLTLRTFHTGGIAGGVIKDITQGLPLAEMFFEVYQSRFQPRREGAVISPVDAVVHEIRAGDKSNTYITLLTREGEEIHLEVPPTRAITVEEGQEVKVGDALTDGYKNPLEILSLLGPKPAQRYLIDMLQSVYRSQGVTTNDKHFEVIIRQMLKFIKVHKSGDSEFLEGTYVNKYTFQRKNQELLKSGQEPAVGSLALLGVKKSAINSDSFISAASFQETARVLSAAALEGRRDRLVGLKENIVLGREIPAGTGFPIFKSLNYLTPSSPKLPEADKLQKVPVVLDSEE